jgi:hypothetical protein
MSCNRVIDSCPGGNRRSYISTEPFAGHFLKYNEETSSLSVITTNAELCPPGRILKENGKKLYPDANPGINQYYVGVYDSVSFLKGFIDPNASVFSEFNANKPTYLEENKENELIGPDAGAPVYTKGNISAISYNKEGSNNDNYIQLINDINGGTSANMGYDGAEAPYVECYTTNESGAGSSRVYMETVPGAAMINLQGPSAGEAKIEAAVSGGGFVGLYASSGNVVNSGVLTPYNTCGIATLNGTTGVAVTIPAVSEPVAILSRKSFNGNGGALTWNVVGTTLTIYSTESNDVGEVGWLLLSSSD